MCCMCLEVRCKNLFWKISWDSQENIYDGDLSLAKLQNTCSQSAVSFFW